MWFAGSSVAESRKVRERLVAMQATVAEIDLWLCSKTNQIRLGYPRFSRPCSAFSGQS
jgi:hypothetical protein